MTWLKLIEGRSEVHTIGLHYLGCLIICSRPPGVFEFNNFAAGTKAVMDAVVMATQNGATVIIGKDLYIELSFLVL